MLVITRKLGESFFIGDNVEIRILELRSDKAKIGIEAPKEINVARKELLETKNSNKEAAMSANAADYEALLKLMSTKNLDKA